MVSLQNDMWLFNKPVEKRRTPGEGGGGQRGAAVSTPPPYFYLWFNSDNHVMQISVNFVCLKKNYEDVIIRYC